MSTAGEFKEINPACDRSQCSAGYLLIVQSRELSIVTQIEGRVISAESLSLCRQQACLQAVLSLCCPLRCISLEDD